MAKQYFDKINGYYVKDTECREGLATETEARTSADTALGGKIGDLSELTTTATADLVAAINEVDSHADTNATAISNETTARESADGDLTQLATTAQSNLVSAINEVDSHADTNAANIAVIIGNDTGKSMREVAQEVSATVYTPQGSCTFANLPNLSAESTKVGFVYDVTDAFTTTSDFKEGAGIEVPAGTNVVVMEAETVSYDAVTPEGSENPSEEGWYELDDGNYVLSEDTVVDSGKTYYAQVTTTVKKWDLLGFNLDLSPYQKKIMDSSVSVAGTTQTTVEGAISALAGAMATIDAIYPVGTIYQNAAVNTNPATLFGVGTWEKIEGKFLYGTATGIALGSPGGAPTVTLGEANIPKHFHSITIGAASGSFSGSTGNVSGSGGSWTHGHPVAYTAAGTVVPLSGGQAGGLCGIGNVFQGGIWKSVAGWGEHNYIFDADLQHTHPISGNISVDFGTKNSSYYGGDSQGNTTAFSIIPPYVAVNIWKRTA